MINSPRSLEAFRRQGILMEEIAPVSYHDIETELRREMKGGRALSPGESQGRSVRKQGAYDQTQQ